jgi:type IV pilus assembly protein PilV
MNLSPRARKARGFTLIEVLVTLLVVSFGLLGFASLLTKSVVSNRQSYARSQASLLAYDVIERMRVNRAAALNGAYSIAIGSSPSGGTPAGDDLVDWKANVSNFLPQGDGAVSVDATGSISITLEWDDNGDGVVTRFVTQSSL